jgi:hypothetical protein
LQNQEQSSQLALLGQQSLQQQQQQLHPQQQQYNQLQSDLKQEILLHEFS